MLDSPSINNLSKTLEVTRAHKMRKQSEAGDKEEFFKKVHEKLEDKEKKKREDEFYRTDEVDVSHTEENAKLKEENDPNYSVNKADSDLPGSRGKSIDIKI